MKIVTYLLNYSYSDDLGNTRLSWDEVDMIRMSVVDYEKAAQALIKKLKYSKQTKKDIKIQYLYLLP